MMRPRQICLLVLLVCLEVYARVALCAEETIRTPSEQMKDAVNKLNKAPATIGKSLQGMTDSAKERLQKAFGGKTKPDTKAEPADLNVPAKTSETAAPAHVMKEGSRDPFRSPLMPKKVNTRVRENLSPLEQKDLSQLKVVGIVWDIKEPRAMVEDTAGLGYVVKVGTPIGSNDGTVKAIHRNRIVVEEFTNDIYGVRKKIDRSLNLATE